MIQNTPKKTKKVKKKHLKNVNFEKKKKVGFFFLFSTHPASFKKNVIFGYFSRGGNKQSCQMMTYIGVGGGTYTNLPIEV